MNSKKSILGSVFGARRLNANEDSESMLGYDLYSSALADILTEPTLSMPITVGLYAKWGSGKSFLLGKLREEMKIFTRWELTQAEKLDVLKKNQGKKLKGKKNRYMTQFQKRCIKEKWLIYIKI